MKKIGEILEDKGLLTRAQISDALIIQKQEKIQIGKILTSYNYISNMNFYQNLALQLGLDFVDINKFPSDSSLLDYKKISCYLMHHFIPYRCIDEHLTIITCQNPSSLADNKEIIYLSERFNLSYKITSPHDIRWLVEYVYAENLTLDAQELLGSELKNNQKYFTANLLICSFFLILYSFFVPKICCILLYLSNIFYIANNLFKLFLLFTGIFFKKPSEKLEEFSFEDCPIYTILIPLYKETNSLDHLIEAIDNLDYPKTKLDVKLILEQDDILTIQNVQSGKYPNSYEIIYVPASSPRTKAKACNYAMAFAKGEFLTIYDAEDVPERSQLKKALKAFKNGPENLACVQAKLNYYNKNENFLTKSFSIEYSIWFEYMLKALEFLSLPIPLGGTSCHFKTAILKKLCFWDAYNVTEDAELGMRLAASNYKISIIDSLTEEESPIFVGQWLKQRTRWIKGYLQTYLINFRYSLGSITRFKYFIGLHFFIGLPCFSFILSLFNIIASALIFLTKQQNSYFSDNLKNVSFINLITSFSLPFISALIVKISKKEVFCLNILLFPFYYILHSVAAFRAVKQLISSPFYWEKTDHGLSKFLPQSKNLRK